MEKIIGKANDLVLFLMGADRDTLWDLTEHKEKRSLSQNAYYWVLLGKVAQKIGISASEIHNLNLRELGLVLRVNESLVPIYLPDDDKTEKSVLHAETYHLKPTSQVKEGKDGKPFRCYVMLRGSSTFNVEEMAALLSLMVQDAKAQGIETMTPEELAHMKEVEKNAQAHKSGSNNSKGKAKG